MNPHLPVRYRSTSGGLGAHVVREGRLARARLDEPAGSQSPSGQRQGEVPAVILTDLVNSVVTPRYDRREPLFAPDHFGKHETGTRLSS